MRCHLVRHPAEIRGEPNWRCAWPCVVTFVTCGFEHSVANMTFLSIGLMNQAADVAIGGVIYNLVIVTIGNVIGGVVFVALPYYLTAKAKLNKQ